MMWESYLTFIIEANLGLLFLIVFYILILRKLSHFNLQRLFLISAPLLAASIPLMSIDYTIEAQNDSYTVIQGLNGIIPNGSVSDEIEVASTRGSALIDWGIVLGISLFVSGFFFFVKLLYQLIRLNQRLQSAQWNESLGVFISSEFDSAFAFSNRVYLPKHFMDLSSNDLKLVIEHEQQHVRLNHHADILLLGFMRSLFWFSPAYWALNYFLKATHEFQADAKTNPSATETRYSELLLQLNQQQPVLAFAAPFSQNLIKMRVTKLNQPKSNTMKKGLFFLTAPVVGILLFAFALNPTLDQSNQAMPSLERADERISLALPMELHSIRKYSEFGMRKDPFSKSTKLHKGIDLVAPEGTPVFASASGIVRTVEQSDEGYGNRIILEHNDSLTTSYAHLAYIDVMEGDEVKTGDPIGVCGNSGLSTGPHLHFEVRIDDEPVNPEQYLFIDRAAIDEADLKVDRSKLKVIIDPGHGGQDGGARNNDILEKDLSWAYAAELKGMLEEKGFDVQLTRGGDFQTSLQDRVSMTADYSEALLISLHFNQSNEIETQGIETYVFDQENRDGKLSRRFAQLFGTTIANQDMVNRGLKTSEFYILKNSKCPAALIELGFLTSRQELHKVSQPEYRQKLCSAIATSVDLYAQ